MLISRAEEPDHQEGNMFRNGEEERPLAEEFWRDRFNKINNQYKMICEQKVGLLYG